MRVSLRAVGEHQGAGDPGPQPAHGLAIRRDPLRRVAPGTARAVHDRPHLPRVHVRRPGAVHPCAAPRGDRGCRRLLPARPELARDRALGRGRRRRRIRHRPVQARPRALHRHSRHVGRRLGQRLPRSLDERGDRREPGVRLRVHARRRLATPDPCLRLRPPARRAAGLPLPHDPAALVVHGDDGHGVADRRRAARVRGLVRGAHVRARGLVARPRRPRRLRPRALDVEGVAGRLARLGQARARVLARAARAPRTYPRRPLPHLLGPARRISRVHRVDHGPRARASLDRRAGSRGGRCVHLVAALRRRPRGRSGARRERPGAVPGQLRRHGDRRVLLAPQRHRAVGRPERTASSRSTCRQLRSRIPPDMRSWPA